MRSLIALGFLASSLLLSTAAYANDWQEGGCMGGGQPPIVYSPPPVVVAPAPVYEPAPAPVYEPAPAPVYEPAPVYAPAPAPQPVIVRHHVRYWPAPVIVHRPVYGPHVMVHVGPRPFGHYRGRYY